MSEKKKCTLAENILDILQMELKILKSRSLVVYLFIFNLFAHKKDHSYDEFS